jgi:hypothetical protein
MNILIEESRKVTEERSRKTTAQRYFYESRYPVANLSLQNLFSDFQSTTTKTIVGLVVSIGRKTKEYPRISSVKRLGIESLSFPWCC